MSRIRFFVLAASMVALATAFAACGSGGGAAKTRKRSSTKRHPRRGRKRQPRPHAESQIRQGKKAATSTSASPARSRAEARETCPQLDVTATAKGDAKAKTIDFERRSDAALRPGLHRIQRDGVRSRPDHLRLRQIGLRTGPAGRRPGKQPAASPPVRKPPTGLKVGEFVDNLKNEGGADVDGTDHQDQRRPQRRRRDRRDHQADRKPGLQRAAGSRRPAAARRTRRGQGRTDEGDQESARRRLRRRRRHRPQVRSRIDVEPKGSGEKVEVDFELSLGSVNEEQDITAPSGAKPLEGLFQKLGVNPLELLEGASGGGGPDLGGLLEGLTGGSSAVLQRRRLLGGPRVRPRKAGLHRMPAGSRNARGPAEVREPGPVVADGPADASFLRTPLGWPYLLAPLIPIAVVARPRGRPGDGRLRRLGAGDHPHGGADGAGDRGAGGALGPGHRRPAQRHLRQRAGADHRPLRPRPGAAGGGQGLDRRLDHRQHPAGPRRGDAGRRDRPRQTVLQPHQRQHPDLDADAGRGGAADAGDLRAGRGQGAARSRGPRRSTTAAPSSTSRWRSRSSSSSPT